MKRILTSTLFCLSTLFSFDISPDLKKIITDKGNGKLSLAAIIALKTCYYATRECDIDGELTQELVNDIALDCATYHTDPTALQLTLDLGADKNNHLLDMTTQHSKKIALTKLLLERGWDPKQMLRHPYKLAIEHHDLALIEVMAPYLDVNEPIDTKWNESPLMSIYPQLLTDEQCAALCNAFLKAGARLSPSALHGITKEPDFIHTKTHTFAVLCTYGHTITQQEYTKALQYAQCALCDKKDVGQKIIDEFTKHHPELAQEYASHLNVSVQPDTPTTSSLENLPIQNQSCAQHTESWIHWLARMATLGYYR